MRTLKFISLTMLILSMFIDALSQYSVSIGPNSWKGSDNVAVGRAAGDSMTGSNQVYIGAFAGRLSRGPDNIMVGSNAGIYTTTGARNIFMGFQAGNNNTTGFDNIYIGYRTGRINTYGSKNTYIGDYAGHNNISGIQNVAIGSQAGYSTTGSNNLFLGYHAGRSEAGSNKLYISNSSTSTPLIYGEFDNNRLTVHGDLGIGTKTPQQKLDVRGNIISNTSNPFIWFKHNNENVGILGSDGSIYGGTATNLGLYVYGNNALELSTNNSKRMVIDGSGRVGIGTPTPQRRFEVSGADAENESFSIRNTSYSSTDDSGAVSIRMGFGNHVTKVISLDKFAVNVSKLNLYAEYGYNIHALGLSLTPVAADLCNAYFTGKVGIGTDSPGYELDVYGTIRAREVKIDLDGTCVPDFVFKEGYQLMGLQELEQFVQTNHHLPEIPSEKEMHENGVNMMELQMKLLQKIEELTLYTIQQEEKMRVLEERMGTLVLSE